jgi:hypothetical protein
MKKIITIAALAATLFAAPAFAKTHRAADHSNAGVSQTTTYTGQSDGNFQDQWNDGNW